MIARKPPEYTPGYFPDDWQITREELETRLDDLAAAKVIPLPFVLSLGEVLVKADPLTAEAIENALEDHIWTAGEHIPVEAWAKACLMLCPELYGEPRTSKKLSEAIPGSRSRMWRLGERARCGLGLWNCRDTHGLGPHLLPQYRWSARMRVKAGLRATPSGKEMILGLREDKPEASPEEIAVLVGCEVAFVERVLRPKVLKPKKAKAKATFGQIEFAFCAEG